MLSSTGGHRIAERGTMKPEEWRDVGGHYSGVYQVSNLGRIRRVKDSQNWRAGHILNFKIDGAGYHHVRLQHDKRERPVSVHTLVAEAFLGECPEGMEVHHKNAIRTDNRPENLEWVTHYENMRHYHESPRKVACASGPKLSEDDVRRIRELHVTGTWTYGRLAERFDVSSRAIAGIIRREYWKDVA